MNKNFKLIKLNDRGCSEFEVKLKGMVLGYIKESTPSSDTFFIYNPIRVLMSNKIYSYKKAVNKVAIQYLIDNTPYGGIPVTNEN